MEMLEVDQHLLRRSGQAHAAAQKAAQTVHRPVGSFVVMWGRGALNGRQGAPTRTASWGRAGGMRPFNASMRRKEL